MSLTTLNTQIIGSCIVDFILNKTSYKSGSRKIHLFNQQIPTSYKSVCLGILKNLCSDIILGQDFQKLHRSLQIMYEGTMPDLVLSKPPVLCGLSAASVECPSLFTNLSSKCKPIPTKSRHFSKDDRNFINTEVTNLLQEGIMEPSSSPWRAQVVVVKDPLERHRKRLCIDYSQTINQFTELDAYPLPRIEEIINTLAKYKIFSTFDLKSAYYQIPLKESEKKYTAFEANGK